MGCREGLGFRVEGLGFRAEGLGFSGLGFGDWGIIGGGDHEGARFRTPSDTKLGLQYLVGKGTGVEVPLASERRNPAPQGWFFGGVFVPRLRR